MGFEKSVVDTSTPKQVSDAIRLVNRTPGLHIQPGIDALWTLYKAPNHTMLRTVIEQRYGAFDLHFGWFCRRVAEELGANNPDALALVDYAVDEEGRQVLTLKPSVVAALSAKKAPR